METTEANTQQDRLKKSRTPMSPGMFQHGTEIRNKETESAGAGAPGSAGLYSMVLDKYTNR